MAPDPDPAKPTVRGRVRASSAQVKARADRTRERIEAARPSSRFIDAAMSTLEHDVASGGGVLAGAIAFRIFMFLVPYAFILVAGLGFAADAASRSPRDLARSAGVSGLAAKAISSVGEASLGQRVTVLVVGGTALLLAARSAVKVLAIIHALVWRLPIQKVRHPTRQAFTLIGILTVAMALVHLIGKVRSATMVGGIAVTALYTVVLIGIWVYLSWRLPRPADTSWQDLLPGAVLFALGNQLLHVFTVLWVARQVSNKSETYGAIGVALALLLWAFVLGRIITATAELNAILWWRRHPDRDPALDPGDASPGSFDAGSLRSEHITPDG